MTSPPALPRGRSHWSTRMDSGWPASPAAPSGRTWVSVVALPLPQLLAGSGLNSLDLSFPTCRMGGGEVSINARNLHVNKKSSSLLTVANCDKRRPPLPPPPPSPPFTSLTSQPALVSQPHFLPAFSTTGSPASCLWPASPLQQEPAAPIRFRMSHSLSSWCLAALRFH